ncbi:hypothetical protein C8Q78DRAFT_1003420 [Trametes maxima]|nr:hypothetical protein C8Q78DRAFT_1003420 [Trametes maxima]
MEYRPRYTQPFTLEEARQLEVPIITEEISRLQNSLAHLERTQADLREALSDSPDDADLSQALGENETVIGSQRERISMLRMVLVEKGVPMSAHYDLEASQQSSPDTTPIPPVPQMNGVRQAPPALNGDPLEHGGTTQEAEEDGVYL